MTPEHLELGIAFTQHMLLQLQLLYYVNELTL